MAGGYITEQGFTEDKEKATKPQEAPLTSPCGKAKVVPEPEPKIKPAKDESNRDSLPNLE